MANDNHLSILKQGVSAWNAWREAYPDVRPDLTEANLGGAHREYREDRWPADLPPSARAKPVLQYPELNGVNLRGAVVGGTYFGQAQLREAVFRGATGQGVDFRQADLRGANFDSAAIQFSTFQGSQLQHATFRGYANFLGTSFSGAEMQWAQLQKCNFPSTRFENAQLQHADLTDADLQGSVFQQANLTCATLERADLRLATFVGTNLSRALLNGARVFGISAWEVNLRDASQSALVITPRDEPEIAVDDLEVAQFVYLLLNNESIRRVIDTVTSKVVLILGSFAGDRKPILDALRHALRAANYTPILFDFEKPSRRDLTETISTLAHMARFVIADLTDARSVRQELERIVPGLPSVPVQPLLLATDPEFAMFDHFRRYPWVLKPERYESQEALIDSLRTKVIPSVETAVKALRP